MVCIKLKILTCVGGDVEETKDDMPTLSLLTPLTVKIIKPVASFEFN